MAAISEVVDLTVDVSWSDGEDIALEEPESSDNDNPRLTLSDDIAKCVLPDTKH